MPCKLTPSATGDADFETTSGTEVIFSVTPNNPPGTLRLVGVAYDGGFFPGPMATFTVHSGIKSAVAVLAAAVNGERGILNEECGAGATQPLSNIISSTNPTRIILLEGK